MEAKEKLVETGKGDFVLTLDSLATENDQKDATENGLNYYCVIPAKVLEDKNIVDKAKILYGHISGLSKKRGYCFATNEHFEKKLDCGTTTVKRLLAELIDNKHIVRVLVYDINNTNQVVERRLYIADAFYAMRAETQGVE